MALNNFTPIIILKPSNYKMGREKKRILINKILIEECLTIDK